MQKLEHFSTISWQLYPKSLISLYLLQPFSWSTISSSLKLCQHPECTLLQIIFHLVVHHTEEVRSDVPSLVTD